MKGRLSHRPLIAGLLLFATACGAPSLSGQPYPASLDALARRAADAVEYGMGAEIVPDEPDVTGDGSMQTQAATLPPSADLRRNMSPIANQASFGSCTAFATVKGLREYLARREGRPEELSARYFWYASRAFVDQKVKKPVPAKSENTGIPTGMAIQAIRIFGTVPERAFPYPTLADFAKLKELDPAKRDAQLDTWAAEAPPKDLADDAKKWRIQDPMITVGSIHGLRKALSEGKPVVIAARLFESFKGPNVKATGLVPAPNPKTEKEIGGHAMIAVGYDNQRQVIVVRNSWGTGWGDQGYCYFPYAYFRQMGRDGRGLIRGGWTLK